MPDPKAPIVIRRPRPDDAAAVVAIMGEPDVLAGLLQLPYPTEAAWRKRIEEMPVGPATAELFIVAERGGEVVGNAGVHPPPHLRRRHAAGIGMAVAKHAQGQGVGTALMAAIVDWADNWAQLLRLELTVYTDNAAAQALYRKFGFEIEGTHRAYAIRDGAYVDALAMARLHPKPPTPRSSPQA
ncbi:MAG TPA: GNAT family N-acetyltransferase [Burkholderiaceae bacterium]|nr:GNAT family N-acetyltransferase [Burkholderiaceae bacterium]